MANNKQNDAQPTDETELILPSQHMDLKGLEKVKGLVEKYERVMGTGLLKKYSEEETKKDFILPLFEALGWDVHDKREVSAEEHIKSSGRVDYGFYLDNRIQFYLEAKPLKADLNKEEYARQAIRYAWNKGVTWAVLTDFEHIKIFNTQDIKASLASKLLFEIPYNQYVERFEQLHLLSKTSSAHKLLDKYAEEHGKKLQKVPISSLLYNDLNECREMLTQSLAIWNEKLKKDRELLDEGVQKLLDRLIFLRVAEDRGIEPPTLIPLIRQWEAQKNRNEVPLYKSMTFKFRELDGIYNSNLFIEHPFESWEEHDGTTERVIKKLYGKEGYYEYDFKVMPADVLGTVYENYLGYKLSQSKKGVEVHKDAKKRKEQGIYYTPHFIVEHIVKNTLGPVLERCRTIEDVKRVKVLDPACGSGSFLVQALELINDKYKEMGAPGNILTKIQILTENIYGVDLDEQAVEIARLNLLINALDGKMKLPSLDQNIKNGNSLISGTDAELKKYFGADFRDKKPFNWEEEFPDVFKQGGFDVVIGNPPYIFARGGNFDESEKSYYYNHYRLQKYQINTHLLFLERAYNLLKSNGRFGFIIPNNWLTINSFANLREFLLKNVGDLSIVNAVDTIFGQASVDTCVLMFTKSNPTNIHLGEIKDGVFRLFAVKKPSDFEEHEFIINIGKFKEGEEISHSIQLKKFIPLNQAADVKSGLKAYEVGKGNPPQTKEMKDKRIYHSTVKENVEWVKYLDGVDVGRYILGWSGEYLRYGDNLAAPRRKELFEGPRILVRQIPSKPPHCINAVYTTERVINDLNSNNIINPKSDYDLKYLLGIINSKLISYWFIQTFDKFQRKIFPQFKVNELERFPIYPATKKEQKSIIELVDKILALQKELQQVAKNSSKWESLKSEIEKTDRKIDEEVYKLYGLAPEEIKIVEGQV